MESSGWEELPFCKENKISGFALVFETAAWLAQSVERLTAEWEVAASISGTGPILMVLKWLRNESAAFALQMARPSRGSDDHVKWRFRLQ